VAALIPLAGAAPFTYRMQLHLPGAEGRVARSAEAEDDGGPAAKGGWPAQHPNLDCAGELAKNTLPGDVILTDLFDEGGNQQFLLGYALPWLYRSGVHPLQRTDAESHDTHSLAGIAKLREQYKDRRVLYLWDAVGPNAIEEGLAKSFPHRTIGGAVVYLINDPQGTWKKAGDAVVAPVSPPTPAAVTPVPPTPAPTTPKPPATTAPKPAPPVTPAIVAPTATPKPPAPAATKPATTGASTKPAK